MIRINQIKLKTDHKEADLKEQVLRLLRIKEDALLYYSIVKQSLDARKKPDLYYIYTVDAQVTSEKNVLKRNRNKNVTLCQQKSYSYQPTGTKELRHRPVVIGSGPAGLFCAYMLAEWGYRPVVIERGMPVEERTADVQKFWDTGILNPESNVQFGEGGAGTFSDGKLNTLVKDAGGRNHKVLEIFTEQGAPADILYINKPHIGTDILSKVVKNMRTFILSHGGEVHFHSKVTDITYETTTETTKEDTNETVKEAKALRRLSVQDTRTKEVWELETEIAVLAIGHSARDTFEMLHAKGLPMSAKSFAVGVRMEHPQAMINQSQYGREVSDTLPAAAYKLTANLENGRGVYTFCMCPGGFVVNASSEEGRLAVNGMSYHNRDGKNANSAVIVTVTPDDYGSSHPLAGMEFQRRLEEKAYQIGQGNVPVQLFEDFCNNRTSDSLGSVVPQIKGTYQFANVRNIFPEELSESLQQGIMAFDHKITGYARKDALISGVESRTSSPVKITRNADLESQVSGLYPCGEGAGYAGGITSAAMDGMKAAEAIASKYRILTKETRA